MPTADLFDPDPRCIACRCGAHRACRPKGCECDHPHHDTRRGRDGGAAGPAGESR